MRHFEFEIFRLQTVAEDGQLPFLNVVKDDSDIVSILTAATQSKFDEEIEARNAVYRWDMRDLHTYSNIPGRARVCTVLLGRETLLKRGAVMTDDGVVDGVSRADPPLVDWVVAIFDLDRHLVAVEYASALMGSNRWRSVIHSILARAAASMNFNVRLLLEPLPQQEEILNAFRSFSKLNRLKVMLRLPNPELTRYTKALKEQMEDGGISEWLTDMRNPKGLSQKEEGTPFAAAALAQSGYKEGDVLMEGYVDGEHRRLQTGERAIRRALQDVKSYVRGALSTAKTKEARQVLADVVDEIDKAVMLDDWTE